jgi:hypothetical protein
LAARAEELNRHSPDSRRFREQDRAFDRLGQRQIAVAANGPHPSNGSTSFIPNRRAMVETPADRPRGMALPGIAGAPAGDALGVGEAADIAVVVSRGLDLVIDDRKARRILRERFSQVRTCWTVDLLQARPVVTALGRCQIDSCFAKARRFGRMHVPRS